MLFGRRELAKSGTKFTELRELRTTSPLAHQNPSYQRIHLKKRIPPIKEGQILFTTEATMSVRKVTLSRSAELLKRSFDLIPLGSQTFSKSYIQYPMNNAPRFVDHAKGCTIVDVDGNSYIDLVSSLAAIILGYCDPDVDGAVRTQLEKGTIFSLPHELEIQLAERIVKLSPNAEQVRFGKNGSDATSGAIRLARAITKKDRVAVCGYHGWHDWFIGSTTKNLGVPKQVSELTHTFSYNDAASLEKELTAHPGEFAAVILEPANVVAPTPSFLSDIKSLTHKHGALLVFDETVTGFRYSLGGAQEKFGITADLVTYGKALANGYPICAIAGPKEYMKTMEEIFFSFTFGGEALSLAASCATLDKLERCKVPEVIAERGARLQAKIRKHIETLAMSEYCSVTGDPSWFFTIFKDIGTTTSWELKTLFMQEMLKRGVLTMGPHNLNFSHDDSVIETLANTYSEVLGELKRAVESGTVVQSIDGKPLKPLFTVRKT